MTEDAWQVIKDEFGVYSSTDIATRMGYRADSSSLIAELRAAGQLLGAERNHGYVYPGFQLSADGAVLEVIPEVIRLARDAAWRDSSVIFWLCTPSGYFNGHRAVDCLAQPQLVLDAANQKFNTEW